MGIRMFRHLFALATGLDLRVDYLVTLVVGSGEK